MWLRYGATPLSGANIFWAVFRRWRLLASAMLTTARILQLPPDLYLETPQSHSERTSWQAVQEKVDGEVDVIQDLEELLAQQEGGRRLVVPVYEGHDVMVGPEGVAWHVTEQEHRGDNEQHAGGPHVRRPGQWDRAAGLVLSQATPSSGVHTRKAGVRQVGVSVTGAAIVAEVPFFDGVPVHLVSIRLVEGADYVGDADVAADDYDGGDDESDECVHTVDGEQDPRVLIKRGTEAGSKVVEGDHSVCERRETVRQQGEHRQRPNHDLGRSGRA